ncbi:MAG TPA: hypothetical protein VMT20_28405 [Terriglobia bacterium]|nr:hypothetical protein [Terriglobia bacterium]
MKLEQCDREQAVLDAFTSGRWATPWGEEIRQHAASCAVCSEVVLVAEALRHEEQSAETEVRLPSAGLVWWKAQLAARRAAEQRAAQPIALVERFAQAVGALSAFGIGVWQWPRIAGWLGGAKFAARVPATSANGAAGATGAAGAGDWTHQLLQGVNQVFSQPSGYLVLVSAAACLSVIAFAAYVVWREE